MAPDFSKLSALEEDVLAARLEAVRASISHGGEKGRALEFDVRQLLRGLLPPEYGLTTGFIAWTNASGTIELSSQLDIIVYDAIRHSPLIHLESWDVLPIEAVFAYVEVKASLTSTSDTAAKTASNSIEACIATNRELRRLKERSFNVPAAGSPISMHAVRMEWLAPRAYVIAFEPVGGIASDADMLASRMAEVLKRNRDAHLHGVLIPHHGFFYTRPVDVRTALDDDYSHVLYTTDHPLLAFKTILLQGLATFPRPPEGWTPAIDQYLNHKGKWIEKAHVI